MNRSFRAALATSAVLALALTGCGGDDGEDSAAATTPSAEAAEADSALDLSADCPATVVLQQDWQPEAEHAGMYNLVGDDYTVDVDAKSVTGSLVAGGVDTGVDVEVRPGGPNVGFQPVPALMYLDDDITLGAVNTDAAIVSAVDQPTVAVVSQLTVSPQVIMWDPATYPDATTIQEAAAGGAAVVASGDDILSLMSSQGIITDAQKDTSYEGTPARFVADPSILQQGFATAEPYIYENEVAEWAKPIAYQTLAEVGYDIYPEPLAVRADKQEELAPCLEKLVPVLQQSQIDYFADPDETNALIVDLVEQYATGWTYSLGVAEYSAQTQIDGGFVTDDPASGVFGQFDPARMQSIVDTFVPLLADAGTITDTSVTAEELYTNEYLDDSISMG